MAQSADDDGRAVRHRDKRRKRRGGLTRAEIPDDAAFVYDFLVAEHVLLVPGTGFNWPTPDHVRIVTLPEARVLTEAIERLGNFLSSYRA